jgi:hypothetical protein
MLFRIILLSILGYLLYRYLKKMLSPPSQVKGQAHSREKKKNKDNIEDAEFEDIDG